MCRQAQKLDFNARLASADEAAGASNRRRRCILAKPAHCFEVGISSAEVDAAVIAGVVSSSRILAKHAAAGFGEEPALKRVGSGVPLAKWPRAHRGSYVRLSIDFR